MGQHQVGWSGPDVEKKRAVRLQNSSHFPGPFSAPSQIRLSILPVGILLVLDPEIVRRRRDNKIDMFIRQPRHAFDAILLAKIKLRHRYIFNQINASTRKNPSRPAVAPYQFCIGTICLRLIAMADKPSKLKIADREFTSRLLVGTGKFASNELMRDALISSGTELVTVALRRADLSGKHDPFANILDFIDPKRFLLLPNTSGARNATEAVRLARLAAAAGLPTWIKLEIHPDPRYLLPDPVETLAAAEILVKEGFTVLPYINADPVLAKRLQDVGTATVMPLGSPIGSNRGIETRPQIEIIIEQATVPVVVDAGLGAPSQAAEAMEMGADAVLVNTAIAIASDPVRMAKAFRKAIEAGREAREIGLAEKLSAAAATSPLTGFLSQ
jgi:thiazole synthase